MHEKRMHGLSATAARAEPSFTFAKEGKQSSELVAEPTVLLRS